MEFSGSLVMDDNLPLPATLRVDGDFLAIDSEAGQLGRWPLDTCRLAKSGDAFLMMIGEEAAAFQAKDPDPLNDWIDTRWPLAAPESTPVPEAAAAASPVVAPPAARIPNPSTWGNLSLAQVAGLGVAIVMLAIFVTALVARDRPTPNLGSIGPTATTTPATPALFAGGVDKVTLAWNEAADRLGLNLFLLEAPSPNRLQMNLAEGLTLYATEDPATGFVRTLMISAGPTTGEDQGEEVLAAWGTLVVAVNPELDGEGRRQLLAELGIEPRRPLPNGIESQASAGGASYTLRSGVLGGRALLIVTPLS